jgi:dephospho-CoA kinase
MQKYHFEHFSATVFITQEILKRNLTVDRDNMRIVADDLRKVYGPGYIIEQLYVQAVQSGKNAVIESVRAIGELEFLRRHPHVSLWAVDASPRIRYQRIAQRRSVKDNVSFEYFLKQEANESNNTNPNEMNLPACIALSDQHLNNDGTKEELQKQIDMIMTSRDTAK